MYTPVIGKPYISSPYPQKQTLEPVLNREEALAKLEEYSRDIVDVVKLRKVREFMQSFGNGDVVSLHIWGRDKIDIPHGKIRGYKLSDDGGCNLVVENQSTDHPNQNATIEIEILENPQKVKGQSNSHTTIEINYLHKGCTIVAVLKGSVGGNKTYLTKTKRFHSYR